MFGWGIRKKTCAEIRAEREGGVGGCGGKKHREERERTEDGCLAGRRKEYETKENKNTKRDEK